MCVCPFCSPPASNRACAFPMSLFFRFFFLILFSLFRSFYLRHPLRHLVVLLVCSMCTLGILRKKKNRTFTMKTRLTPLQFVATASPCLCYRCPRNAVWPFIFFFVFFSHLLPPVTVWCLLRARVLATHVAPHSWSDERGSSAALALLHPASNNCTLPSSAFTLSLRVCNNNNNNALSLPLHYTTHRPRASTPDQ